MHKFEYPFFTQNILIATPDRLNEKKAFELNTLLEKRIATVFRNLSSRVHESYTSRLNSSDIDYPVHLPAETWDFIQHNLAFYELTNGQFSPFEDTRGKSVAGAVSDFWTVDEEQRVIRRQQDVIMSSSHLLTSYTMERISNLLQEFGLKEFLISAHNIYLTHGHNDWALEFQNPVTGKNIEVITANVAAAMDIPIVNKEEDSFEHGRNPFRDRENSPEWAAVIAESKGAMHARVAARMAGYVKFGYQFPEFISEWSCGLTVVSENEEIKQYSLGA